MTHFRSTLVGAWGIVCLTLAPPCFAGGTAPQEDALPRGPYAVLPHRQRAEAVNRMLRDRLDHLLPGLMRECGIDLWLVINREYNEDPVYFSLVPEPVFAARRTTMLVFFDRGEDAGVERLTVSRYGIEGLYQTAWEGGPDQGQWQRLAELVAERAPRKVGVNVSQHWAFGDGLSAGLHEQLSEALEGVELVSAEELCIRWLETRSQEELKTYPHVVRLARSVIAEAFSSAVITAGVTSTDDVAWWIRQRFEELGLDPWFMPYVNVQRKTEVYGAGDSFMGLTGVVIEPGDVLHTDVGIGYLRLHTDTQEMGYVLRSGEDDVPEGLKRALALGNRWQDLLTGSFVRGRNGNEILADTLRKAEAEGISCSIYSHPLGFFGHAAGPTIGMWDNQGPTPVRGEWPLHPGTCYAIEGSIKAQVPEWNDQWIQIKLEQDALFDGEQVIYLGGRQTRWHVVR